MVENNYPNIYPEGFPEWEEQMDKWGNHMVNGTRLAAEMAAVGMGLEKDTFT